MPRERADNRRAKPAVTPPPAFAARVVNHESRDPVIEPRPDRGCRMVVPFQERKSKWRGLLDLATGRYPAFVFGGGTGRSLPVFHFHECHPAALEPYLAYLAENGYRTVTSEAVSALVHRGVHPGPRTVVLCFDDAWASFWVVAVPLLKKYGLTAITFVSPERVSALPEPRPQWDGTRPFEDMAIDRSGGLFSSWAELRAMQADGCVDIQAHSLRHVQVACAPEIFGFITPEYTCQPHKVPLVDAPEGERLARAGDLGAPLYPTRSRLSDALRWRDPAAFEAAVTAVQSGGGAAFFEQPDWRETLMACVQQGSTGSFETAAEREQAILDELVRSREVLNHELGSDPVRHMCFPWAIAGQEAVRLAAQAGYETAFADRLWGRRAVHAGDRPYQLMRLRHEYLFCLPGKNRSWLFGTRAPSASRGLDLASRPLPE